MYNDFLLFFEQNKHKIQQYGKKDVVKQEWIDDIEKQLGFSLPDSYKWWSKEFEFFQLGANYINFVTPPQIRDTADVDILYTYKINLENKITDKKQLSIFEPDDELYYLNIEDGIKGNEYRVYLRDYYNDEELIYANNFLEFIELKIQEL